MEKLRKPFQGVKNIVRFNWHFYALILGWFILTFLILKIFQEVLILRIFLLALNSFIAIVVAVSLVVSAYVYDFSGLYEFTFLNDLKISQDSKVANINAGFDETSEILKAKFSLEKIEMMDFYDEEKHTEVSIKRARKLYPNSPETVKISTEKIPFQNEYFDDVFLIFAAHEIRNNEERIRFFKEINRVSKTDSNIIITEHLRDVPNFLAYNIVFLHFLSLNNWKNTFEKSQFKIEKHQKQNPFINVFYLKKYGTST